MAEMKGRPIRVFDHETADKLSDIAVDVRDYNSINIAVIATGTDPTATLSVEGSDEAGGYYLQLPDVNASKEIDSSVNYDLPVGTPFVRLRLASITGTFGFGQGFTVIVTPFNSAGPITVSVSAGAVTVANGGDIAQGSTTDTPFDGAESATARTGISLWKGIKNYVRLAKDALGVSTGAAVVSDANGTLQQYLRGLVKILSSVWDSTNNVLNVATPGVVLELAASVARTSSDSGSAVTGLGWRKRYLLLLDVTAAAAAAGDTLDVYVDVSIDGSTWLNAVHFTQCLGNGGAKSFFAVLDGGDPGTSVIDASSDAAAGNVRPSMAGLPQMRARWEIVDGGGGTQSFTFSVTAWAI